MDHQEKKTNSVLNAKWILSISLIVVSVLGGYVLYSNDHFQTHTQQSEGVYQADSKVLKMNEAEFDAYVRKSISDLNTGNQESLKAMQEAVAELETMHVSQLDRDVAKQLEKPLVYDVPTQGQARQTAPNKEGNLDAASRQTGLSREQLKSILTPSKKLGD